MLKLVLNPVNKLTDEEMRKGGKAVITFAENVTAAGTFKCLRANAGINACITACGNFSEAAVEGKVFDKDAEGVGAVLTASVERKVVLKSGETEAQIPGLFVEEDKLANVTFSPGLAGAALALVEPGNEGDSGDPSTATPANPNKGVKLTVETAPDKDTEVTVKISDLTVATGRFVDHNCNHKLKFKPVGAIHVDACSQLKRISGLKPNDHTFTIYTKDHAHVAVSIIDSVDDFDPGV